MKLNRNDISVLKDKIKKSKNTVLICHLNPDGDCIGAVVAMKLWLKEQNIDSDIIIPNDVPDFLNFMLSDIDFMNAYRNKEQSVRAIKNAELVICLDFNNFKRAGDIVGYHLSRSNALKIAIDHHQEPDYNQFDLVISDVEISSTCELLYEVMQSLNRKDYITKTVAQCLYTGICTDTGSFSYSCNDKKTYEIVAKLVEKGTDVEFVHQEVYNTYSENRLRLFGFAISERMTLFADKGVGLICLDRKDLDRFSYQKGDTEGLVNYTLMIGNIEVAIMLIQRETIKLSFRSKRNFDVNAFARTYFAGGGHKKAAGATVETGENFEEVRTRLLDIIDKTTFKQV